MAKRQKVAPAHVFMEYFGAGTPYRPFSEADETRLGERLPNVMKTILKKDGWCSYRDQVLWLCDPDDWVPAARAWMPECVDADVLVRSGFGDLFVWDGGNFWFVNVHTATAMMMVPDADWFFSQSLTDKEFAPSTHLPERLAKAREQAGPLEWDEMYAYTPALAIGGSQETSKIERVKAREAQAMLAKLAPLKRC